MRTFQKIGFALYAELVRTNSLLKKTINIGSNIKNAESSMNGFPRFSCFKTRPRRQQKRCLKALAGQTKLKK